VYDKNKSNNMSSNKKDREMKTEIEKFEYYNIPEDDFEFSTS
jgi:hypothetical protein